MSKQKWHKEIKAWADGEQIQFMGHSEWVDIEEDEAPEWNEDSQYRIKPKAQYLYVFADNRGEQILRTHIGQNSHETYIGKIKLEVDDD